MKYKQLIGCLFLIVGGMLVVGQSLRMETAVSAQHFNKDIQHRSLLETNQFNNQIFDRTIQFGESIDALLADDTISDHQIVYTRSGTKFQIWDVTDSNQPIVIGTYYLQDIYPFFDQLIAKNQEYIHLGMWPSGGHEYVQILDVSQPEDIKPVGSYFAHWNLQQIILRGNYAYLTSFSNGIGIVDVSDPTNPQYIIDINPTGDPQYNVYQKLLFWDDYGYLFSSEKGLYVLDFASPILPTTINLFPFHVESGRLDMAIWDQHLYIITGKNLYIYDLANPEKPTQIAIHTIHESNFEIGSNLAVTDGVAYIADFDSDSYEGNGLLTVDVSDPAHPKDEKFYPLPSAINVVDSNGRIYVSAGSFGVYGFEHLANKTEAVIPTIGGMLSSRDSRTSLIFPSGAFSETTHLIYRQWGHDVATGALAGIGQRFGITAVYSNTNQTADLQPNSQSTIEIQYSDSGVVLPETLALYVWDGQEWVREPDSQHNINEKTITATVDHLGMWAILGETNRIWQPTILNNGCPASVDTDLRVYLPLNEATGSTQFNDLTCYEHHGTCSGNSCPAVGVEGVAQTAVHFDGQNDVILLDYENIVTGKVTFATWIKPESTDGIRNIIARGYGAGATGHVTAEVFLRINDGQYQVGSWDGTAYMTSFAMPVEDINNWVHLVGVYDGTSWRLYRNGHEVSRTEASKGALFVFSGFGIGAHSNGTERFFHGTIDDVYIFNRALSDTEIEAMSQANQPFLFADK